ncbi:hypothetical protein [Candidatus Chloroploca asiatica]|uniref:Uncharacterized protein n=1 Tax=Candidatus Chloroploca asiatica TaxID=1506545 RepID=A0A2H3KFT0_9CHLR|nr:hypothetical protein [Candidatus Chloroploca asiatica]PDV96529.1 hypothetical protein A9Q02_20635 [Candidatus Chloroploca asiatica]
MYHTIFAPLTRRQHRRIVRLLALALLPLLLVTSTGYGAERLPVTVAVARSVRRIRCRRCRRPPVAPTLRGAGAVLRRTLPPALCQTSLLLLLLLGARAPTALLLLAGLPLLRWLLTLSGLRWPQWAQHPSGRWLRQTLADLHLALLLALGGLLLGQLLGLTGGALLGAAATPRPPKPTASGRVLDDGTYEVILGDQFAIRHRPVDEFDRRMFLLFLRDIHLVAHPGQRPFLCQTWLAGWFDTLQELLSRWENDHEAGDWQRLMSRRDGPLLPRAQQQAIVQRWTRHHWWSVAEVQAAAQAEGLRLTGRTTGSSTRRRWRCCGS